MSSKHAKRNLTTHACNPCQRKRCKCDGSHPCGSCKATDHVCTYQGRIKQSKSQLRSEIEFLAKKNSENNALFGYLRSASAAEVDAAVLSLRRGDSIASIVNAAFNSGSTSGSVQTTSAEVSSSTSPNEGASWNEYPEDHPSGGFSLIDLGAASSIAQSQRLSLSLSSWSTDSQQPILQPEVPLHFDDNLLANLFDYNVVHSNLEHLLHWVFPQLAMIDDTKFENDLLQGRMQYSSPALVAAILSVSTPLLSNDAETSRRHSELYAREARVLLGPQLQSNDATLPTIQALSLLALKEMRAGNLREAESLSTRSLAWVVGMIPHTTNSVHESIAATFCSVYTLTRLIQLVTLSRAMATDTATMRSKIRELGEAAMRDSSFGRDWSALVGQLQPHHRMSASVFELTELIYSTICHISSVEPAKRVKIVMKTYHQCLNWHSAVSATLKGESRCAAFVDFVHIHYQFVILTILSCISDNSPALTSSSSNIAATTDTTSQTRIEASNAVISLTQSYSELCSLRNAPVFTPYFVYAAGVEILRQIAHGSAASAAPAWHAITLLSEMASDHTSAVDAEQALRLAAAAIPMRPE